jgi:hypothetical protein
VTDPTPGHDFLLPRLTALVAEAQAAGIAHDVAVAVLTDLITGPGFNNAIADPNADSEPHRERERNGADTESLLQEKHALIEQAIAPSGYL